MLLLMLHFIEMQDKNLLYLFSWFATILNIYLVFRIKTKSINIHHTSCIKDAS